MCERQTEMDRPVITLFEAYGSGANVVGPKVAEALGVPYIGQQTSSEQLEAADPKGSGRVNVGDFLKSLAFVDQGSIELLQTPYEQMARQQARTVLDLVKGGGVVLGRNATVILGSMPDVLHVKLEGSRDYRIARAAREANISLEQAALRQMREDTARAEISMDIWHWDPRASAHYDLILSTETFGMDGCVDMILEAAKRKQAKATAGL